MKQKDIDVIDDAIYHLTEGDTCVEIAENYKDDVKDIDTQLYSAMRRLDEAAQDMLVRMNELNKELDLDWDII